MKLEKTSNFTLFAFFTLHNTSKYRHSRKVSSHGKGVSPLPGA